MKQSAAIEVSPFHPGEQQMQTRAGKRESMESFGKRVVRPYLPDQHREFFAQLPFLVVGSVDAAGWPWASLVAGRPGFMHSPDNTTLAVTGLAAPNDPTFAALESGAALGLLGIDLGSRRRNRMNGRVRSADDKGFVIGVDQAFGNCPQYIQNRSVEFVREPDMPAPTAQSKAFRHLDDAAAALIRAADTFFVSSFVPATDRPDIQGVDVSHRGGRPGFVKVDANTLTVPDFTGNFHFNTLGNFLLNPKAGLVFADFERGDLLLLTGTVELLDADHPEIRSYRGAERGWRFTLDHGVWLTDALPFRSTLGEISPNSLLAGDWLQAAAAQEAADKRNAWRPFRIARVEDESSVIRSFYLEPTDGAGLLDYQAGQYLTLRAQPSAAKSAVIRTYTLSSAPGDACYRISVKREPNGVFSQHLHDELSAGDSIEVKAPRGDFYIDAEQRRPALLFAGGVGITPMISMARHLASEGVRTRQQRSLTVFHTAKTGAQRAFAADFRQLQQSTQSTIRYYSVLSSATATEQLGVDYDHLGHITAELLRSKLPLDDYDCYLCGPTPFMQAVYDALRSLGIADERIFAESFGPASLQRDAGPQIAQFEPEAEAQSALIRFTRSGFEQRWEAGDGTLLEVAEEHGLTPEFGCRNGSCGTCAVKLKQGAAARRNPTTGEHQSDEVLICSAVPAAGCITLEIDL